MHARFFSRHTSRTFVSRFPPRAKGTNERSFGAGRRGRCLGRRGLGLGWATVVLHAACRLSHRLTLKTRHDMTFHSRAHARAKRFHLIAWTAAGTHSQPLWSTACENELKRVWGRQLLWRVRKLRRRFHCTYMRHGRVFISHQPENCCIYDPATVWWIIDLNNVLRELRTGLLEMCLQHLSN
jgi:hypothetical protein